MGEIDERNFGVASWERESWSSKQKYASKRFCQKFFGKFKAGKLIKNCENHQFCIFEGSQHILNCLHFTKTLGTPKNRKKHYVPHFLYLIFMQHLHESILETIGESKKE